MNAAMASRSAFAAVLPFAPLALALFASLQAAAPSAAVEEGELEYVSLATLARDPRPYLGRSVLVRFQVQAHPATWNPYLTRFGSADWSRCEVWADEQFLWEREAWDAPAAAVFARRDSVAHSALGDAPRLARFQARAHVSQVFLGRPWIEVSEVQRVPGAIGEGSVLHATRALEHLEKEQHRIALDHFDRALVGEMPDVARAELRRLRDEAQQALTPR
jgi:hypothetical protein